MKPPLKDMHFKEPQEVFLELDTSSNGLSSQEATHRKGVYGPNELKKKEKTPLWKILFHHLFNFMSFVLVGAVVLSLVASQYVDAIVIVLIITINTSIGVTQEYKSEKTMDALRKLSQPTCTVIRDSQNQSIPTEDIVPGDILLLKEGDKVPADLRLFQVTGLECDEAVLTGESIAIAKTVQTMKETKESVALGDRTNCAFMGTTVTKGKGVGIVFATGKGSELGKIAESLAAAKKASTKFEKTLDQLGKLLIAVSIVAISLVLLAGWGWGTFSVYPTGLQTSISTAVAIIPEGLMVVATLTLTLGIKRMAKESVIIRKIASIESLGNTTNICTDKTGTLTQGQMIATCLWVANEKEYNITGEGLNPNRIEVQCEGHIMTNDALSDLAKLSVMIGSLCNSSSISEVSDQGSKWVGVGSPTEVALVVLGEKLKLARQHLPSWNLCMEYPFDSSIKRMSTVYQQSDSHVVFLKGAPDFVMPLCTRIVSPSGDIAFTKNDAIIVSEKIETMASQGLRVLCLCYKELDFKFSAEVTREELETNMVFVGLIGITDPPRKSVPRSVEICHKAGIMVHMVTGDHPSTAKAIAKQIGIIPPHLTQEEEDSLVTTAAVFDSLTEAQLADMPNLPLVIARCNPQSKVKMVALLHKRKKYVAMLGDGVNDCPAIKNSDVGVSMGTGSDVTKESSDMVLLDDDFSSFVIAVTEGRRIFDNIKKFLVQMLAGNVAATIVLVLSVLCSLHPPMEPLHILWVNMVTQTSPALALGIEPASKSVMDKSKRQVDEGYFTLETVVDIFFFGTLVGVFTLGNFMIFDYAFGYSHHEAQSVSFLTLGMLLLVHSYNCRNLHKSFVSEGFLKDYYLHGAFVTGLAFLLLALYVPFIQEDVLETKPLGWMPWVLTIGFCVLFLMLSEIYKLVKKVKRRRSPNRPKSMDASSL